MYELDPAVNLYRKLKLADEVWQVPSELVAFVPREMLAYDAVGKGFDCNQQELMSLIVNHNRPAPKPQPLNAVIRGRKRTSLDANCMVSLNVSVLFCWRSAWVRTLQFTPLYFVFAVAANRLRNDRREQ